MDWITLNKAILIAGCLISGSMIILAMVIAFRRPSPIQSACPHEEWVNCGQINVHNYSKGYVDEIVYVRQCAQCLIKDEQRVRGSR